MNNNDILEMQKTETVIDIQGIMNSIPHRFPFLLVDRIIALTKDVEATGIKNVTANESFFLGHFPSKPVMPGVLIIEALAQTAAVMVFQSLPDDKVHNKLVYFTSIEEVKFRKPVVPGDQLILHTSIIKNKLNLWKMEGSARVDGHVVAEAKFSAMLGN